LATRRAKIDGQQMTAFDVVDDSSTGIAMCYIARVIRERQMSPFGTTRTFV